MYMYIFQTAKFFHEKFQHYTLTTIWTKCDFIQANSAVLIQFLCCFSNKVLLLQQGATQQARCVFASSTDALLQVSNDNLNGEL